MRPAFLGKDLERPSENLRGKRRPWGEKEEGKLKNTDFEKWGVLSK